MLMKMHEARAVHRLVAWLKPEEFNVVKFPGADVAYDPALAREFGQQHEANAVTLILW